MNELIRKFNQKETILVVSSYPDQEVGIRDLNAVAWYTKKTLESLPASKKKRFVIFAEITDQPKIYEDGRFLVIRCWKPNSFSLFFDLLGQIKNFPQAKTLLLEFEFNTFGGFIGTGLFPLFLLILKLLRKKVVLEIHQVLLDINSLSGHLNLKKNSFLTSFFNLALSIFYLVAGTLSKQIIVLEETLKERLSRYVNPAKIKTVFIAISRQKKISRQEARKKLGLKEDELVLLYFGFITWYKGADWLVKECAKQNLRLIMAGGESPTLKKKAHYQRFYREVLNTAKKSKKIQVTGFVDEKDIPTYFAASDLVVLPYRTFMSSSGPFSLALSYHKPFLLSKKLSGYAQSKTFKEALKVTGLDQEDFFFDLSSASFRKKLATIKIRKLQKFSATLAKMRSRENLGKIYLEILENDTFRYSWSYLFGALWSKLRSRPLSYRLG